MDNPRGEKENPKESTEHRGLRILRTHIGIPVNVLTPADLREELNQSEALRQESRKQIEDLTDILNMVFGDPP